MSAHPGLGELLAEIDPAASSDLRDPQCSAGLFIQGCVAAYTGTEDETRSAIDAAIDASKRSGTGVAPALVTVCDVFPGDVGGNYVAALDTLATLLSGFANAPETAEVFAASFVPDAVDAHGRSAEAQVSRMRSKPTAGG